LRVSRAGAGGIENFRGWLTTIVARVCLSALRARIVAVSKGRPVAVMGFTVARGKIVEIDGLLDPDRLARLDLDLSDQTLLPG
jgi:RNA polymerase sigma-70 factor (ECF subfamily)